MNILNRIKAAATDSPTPCYCYDLQVLDANLRAATEAAGSFKLHYAMKACNDERVLTHIRQAGLGVDAVSGGEVELALKFGFAPENIFLSGVGKTDAEMRLAIGNRIGCINIESVEEIPVLQSISQAMGMEANVALRLNPGVDAHTHRDITTGTDEDKFGIPLSRIPDAVDALAQSPNLRFRGIHFHIGSQITDFEPYRQLCRVANKLVADFEAMGLRCEILDMGGGLGIDYNDPLARPVADFEGYFNVFLQDLKVPSYTQIHFEPGRSLVGQCGFLLTRVLLTKTTESGRRLCVVDAGFTELIRPALYGAEHVIIPLDADRQCNTVYDIVGPVCESTDVMARGIKLPQNLLRGDILVVCSAGAYGQTMAMNYNCRALAPTIYI